MYRNIAAVLAGLAIFGQQAMAADKVTLQLGWSAEPEFGGFLQAQQTGIYKKNGIDAQVLVGSPEINATQLLLAGKVDFIEGSSMDALNAVQQGFPVVVVAGIFQRDPQVLISHQGAGNDSFAALKGKPMMIAASDQITFWPFLKQKFGYTDSQIVPYNFDSAPFLANKNAIEQGYVTSEPFALRQAGARVNVFLLSDAGYESYAETIITTAKMIKTHRDLVQRFVDASILGWYSYLYGDPAPANAFIAANNPDMNDAQITYSMNMIKSMGLVDSGEAKTVGIGAMSDAHWQSMFQQMSSLGQYPATMNYRAAYTLQFVNKNSGK